MIPRGLAVLRRRVTLAPAALRRACASVWLKENDVGVMEDIVISPDSCLSKVCEPIESIDEHTKDLVKHMLKAMYVTKGCGLAAPQIGELVRVVVIDCDYRGAEKNPYILINPRIVEASEETVTQSEGCLSFPGLSVEITRPRGVVVEATDLDGNGMVYEASDNLLAICLQHEIDHLDGITMLDHLEPSRRVAALREYQIALEAGACPGD